MVPHSRPEVNVPFPSAVQHFEHANNRAVDEAETILAALKRVLENRIGTLEILYAIELPEQTEHRGKGLGVTRLPRLEVP